ncbi:transposase [Actinacidiphila oryziradicis]|uniref:Transposase n=1 Tax=Actinacidiphila oryziradicis TaxID=2571141 RepID=A0A4U0RUV7_9ACTN|nr:transposase [Actinacidiphila oryziradicis]
MARPSKYSPEFREEAVQVAVKSSKTVSEVARDLDLNSKTLRGWVKKHQKQQESAVDPELTVSERAQLKELERRNRELEMENLFLKKPQRTSRRMPGNGQLRVHRHDATRHSGVRISRHVHVRGTSRPHVRMAFAAGIGNGPAPRGVENPHQESLRPLGRDLRLPPGARPAATLGRRRRPGAGPGADACDEAGAVPAPPQTRLPDQGNRRPDPGSGRSQLHRCRAGNETCRRYNVHRHR